MRQPQSIVAGASPTMHLVILLSLQITSRILPSSSFSSSPLPRRRGGGGGGMTMNLDKGFNILETASKLVPQGRIVGTAKETWKFAWGRMMAELAPQDKRGNYRRPSYNFNGKIGDANFPDEPGRYHLYIGNPCPWCHRTKLALNVLKITPNEISTTLLLDDPIKASRGGWVFTPSQPDPLGSTDLRELYDKLSPNYKGRCTAPLLIDKKTRRVVSNESSDIVRMLNGVTSMGGNNDNNNKINLYPDELTTAIDETNEWVYKLLNNGVYRCGFATTQSAYDVASRDVCEGWRRADEVLSRRTFLCGEVFTEADLRLLPTALRYDGAYAPLFKAGGAHLRVRDFENVMRWLRVCWDMEGVRESIDLEDANASYWKQLFPLNAGGIIPRRVTAREIGLE